MSSGLQPLSLSIVNTRFVVVSQNIFGTLKSGSPSKFFASSAAAAAAKQGKGGAAPGKGGNQGGKGGGAAREEEEARLEERAQSAQLEEDLDVAASILLREPLAEQATQ